MSGHDLAASTAANYRAFTAEARGRSPRYEALALAAADDPLLLGFLDALPVAKRQPNLLFAAARHLLGPPADITALRKLVRDRGDELAAAMRARRTARRDARSASRPPSRPPAATRRRSTVVTCSPMSLAWRPARPCILLAVLATGRA